MENAIENTPAVNWSPNAPKGGRAVLNRMIKDSGTVPLFFGQTLIQSLRDVGYNDTTSALCEHVDNAIQAGASEIRVYFRQTGKKGAYRVDVAVMDNGKGMSPNVLKIATSFGGSTSYDDREGIGRFGMGMKTAALSMSPTLEIYTWQEPRAIYSMTLDVEDVGRDRKNLVELPEPDLHTDLPEDVSRFFTRKMSYPSRAEDQDLVAPPGTDLWEQLSPHGTVVYMPDCDRLTYAMARTLSDHAMRAIARIYRRAIAQDGLRLLVNNRLVHAFDPTFSLRRAQHTRIPDLQTQSARLILSRQVEVPLRENGPETAPIAVKLFRLPIEEWATLPKKVQKHDLKIFDRHTVSILRNGREVFAGVVPKLTGQHSVTHWLRVQIDFPGILDEAFGVSANKQGVRMKGYVEKALRDTIGDDIVELKEELKQYQAAQAVARRPAQPSESEQRATNSDSLHPSVLDAITDESERGQMEDNLRSLAKEVQKQGETEDEAYERVTRSKYILDYHHDPYWPFYSVAHKYGRVILTLNTAHPFFDQLYQPLAGNDSERERGQVMALELMLLSLARTHSRLAASDPDTRVLLEALQREWSETFKVQLQAS